MKGTRHAIQSSRENRPRGIFIIFRDNGLWKVYEDLSTTILETAKKKVW